MKKYPAILFMGALLLACQPETPNIVLIMADDLGYNDLSCYGDTLFLTPNIDRLAAGGIKFTDYHSNGAVCSPTRAALMTGLYQQRSGIEGVVTALKHRDTGLATEQLTLADFLKGQGYVTGLVGKWHLGYDTAFSPLNNGFDYFRGYVSGNIDYQSHIDQVGYYDWWTDKDTVVEKGYSTDLITRHSLEFIRQYRDQKFFLYVAHEAPHYPFQGRNDPPVRTLSGELKTLGARTDKDQAYREMIEAMDEGVGDIFACLQEEDLLENTLIFFCSDNGAAAIHGSPSNWPLNGYKGNFWEGGHRVPAIAYWKGQIEFGTSDALTMSMDVFPTIVDLVAQKRKHVQSFDGQSFLSLLVNADAENEASRAVFWRFGKHKKAVRLDNWKYLTDPHGEYLFDLSTDLGETINLIDSFEIIADSLRNLMINWELEMSQYQILTQ